MPIDPNQLGQDKDFLAASPEDQIKFLSAQDPDFAKASPDEQMGYLSHLKTGQPTQQSAPPAAATPPAPGLMDQATSFVQNATNPLHNAVGLVKGVGDTVHGVGTLIQKGLNVVHGGLGDAVIPPEGQAGLDSMTTANGPGEHAGKAVENVLEFAAGDEALKGLTLMDKVKALKGVAEAVEKYPTLARLITGSARNATVAGGQTLAKTGDPKEAGIAAAIGGAAAPVVEGATSLLGAGLKHLRAAETFKELPAALDKGLSETVSQKAVTDGLKATQGATASEHLADSALQYQKRAKQGYQVVDNAVNGELQPIQDKLDQVKKAIKIQSNLDPDKADALKATKTQLEKALSDTIAKAKANGVPDAEQIIQKADGDYTKFRAQSDLSTRLQKAATAGGPASPAGLHVFSKQVGTPKVVGRVSRLEQALGKDGAEAVQKLASEGRARAEELARQAEIGNAIKKTAITGAAGAAGAAAISYPAYRMLTHH